MPFVSSLVRSRIALALASAAAFASLWILVPAPTYALLTLSVGAPEVSVWLLVIGVAAIILAFSKAHLHASARWAIGLGVVACVLAAIPLMDIPFASEQFDQAMETALGANYLRDVPAATRALMRPAPVAARDLFFGLDTGDVRVTAGVLFASPAGLALTLTVYQPTSVPPLSGPLPVIIQVYGGAWRSGAPSDYPTFARYFASHGYVVFAIDYRHAPEWQWPAQRDDVRSAMTWIHAHAAEYGADPSHIALIGRSAGSQLAILASVGTAAPGVRAVVGYYGPVDLTDGYLHPPVPDTLGIRKIDEDFLGGTPEQVPNAYRDASPITVADDPHPPTLLIDGGRDHIVEPHFGQELYEHLHRSGTAALLVIPWADHSFDAVPHGPSGQMAIYYTERFLAWAMTDTARAHVVR